MFRYLVVVCLIFLPSFAFAEMEPIFQDTLYQTMIGETDLSFNEVTKNGNLDGCDGDLLS